jgi:hypothetical protein
MLSESRQILALLGDQSVTIAAFIGLLVYGIALLARSASGPDLGRALMILCIAMLWLACASTGIFGRDLAPWSPLSVFLLAVGLERRGRSSGRTASETPPGSTSPVQACGDPEASLHAAMISADQAEALSRYRTRAAEPKIRDPNRLSSSLATPEA